MFWRRLSVHFYVREETSVREQQKNVSFPREDDREQRRGAKLEQSMELITQ